MLFSKKSFRQLFASRPTRRAAAWSVPAQLEILPERILLSAATIQEISVMAEPWATMVGGTINSPDGNYDGLYVSFGGVFSGSDVSIGGTGSFVTMFSPNLSGVGTVTLFDANGVQLDQYVTSV